MSPTPWIPDSYPPTHRSDHVDVYQSASRGEVQVSDPYQWLEETSNEVNHWTTVQTTFTQAYLNKNPDRQKLEDKFLASKDYAKVIDDRCIRSICAEILARSSLHRPCLMTDTGIGSTIAVYNHNQVCTRVSLSMLSSDSIQSCTAPRNRLFLISRKGMMKSEMCSLM